MEDGGDGAVRVVARICPASAAPAPAAGTSLFQVAAARGRCPRASGATVSFTPAAASSPSQGRPAAGQRKEEHSLDWCYLQEETNHHVFHHELQPILANHMRNQTHTTTTAGSNACVVACGAAAAKDHLFKGSQEQPGLVTIAMEQILYFAASIGGAVRVSSYQVVQDTHVYDLLEPKEQEVLVLEDDQGKTHLKGLSKVHVKTIEDFTRLGCFDENQDKQQQPTKPFSTQPQPTKASSTQLPTRGHQGLIIHISSSDQDGKERHVAKINFLSLSDYVDPKQKTGGAAAALSNVVQALNSNQSLVPYRESEVTRILQDSLCKTSGAVVIACLEEVSCQDAVSTLSLAARSSHLATQVANKEESGPVPPPKRGRGRPRRRERSALLEPEPKGRASGCGGNNDSCKGRNCGWTDSYPCNCGVMVGKACSCGRPDIDCCSLGDKDACHCDEYLVAKIRDRNQKKLDERQTEKVQERTREIGSRLPVFVKLMKQPDIQKPDLNFCTMYARKCLWLERDHDEARVLLVLEGTTMQWCSKLTVDKYRKNEDESKEPSWFIKFKAWETVVLEASIKAQDICLFELVGRCSNGLMMKLHLIRSQPKVKRSLSPSTSECRGPLEKKKKKKKKMHAPNSPSPKAPAEETHAGPEGSEE